MNISGTQQSSQRTSFTNSPVAVDAKTQNSTAAAERGSAFAYISLSQRIPSLETPRSGGSMGPDSMLTEPTSKTIDVQPAIQVTQVDHDASTPVASCQFRALGYDIELNILHDEARDTYRAEGLFDGPVSSDRVKRSSMTHAQIMADGTTKWALGQVGINAAQTESIEWYSVHLDGDGGGLHLIEATQKSGQLHTAGMLSFMGGVRGGRCQ